MKRTAAALAGALVVVGATASTAATTVIATARDHGSYATAIVDGSARNPDRLVVRVRSWPRQRVTGNYLIFCRRHEVPKAHSFTGRGRFTVRLELTRANPRFCTASVTGGLSGTGRIRLTLVKVS